MAKSDQDKQLRERLGRLEKMIQDVERYKNPEDAARTREIIQALMDFHGAGLDKMLEGIAASPEGGVHLIQSLAREELVSSLLLLYGLHPLDIDTRVRQALDQVRPYLHSHGGNVELLSVADGVVSLRLQGSCHGCPSSAQTLKDAIEEAIYEKAPDVTRIAVEGVVDAPAVEVKLGFTKDSNGHGRMALPVLSV